VKDRCDFWSDVWSEVDKSTTSSWDHVGIQGWAVFQN
jgi:hypothetical protein